MNRELLKYCLQQIEKKLGWASSDMWLNQDFELLSDQIFEETGVKLSVTTLKRVWGKVNYASEPSISTLNALANFIGFANWSELKNGKAQAAPKERSKPSINLRYALATIVVIGLLAVVLGLSDRSASIDLEQVTFGAEPVTLGLPNSVVFTYDFGGNQVDNATIQQSWNDKLTFSIDPQKEAATGIYYYPGYFRAKLLANNQVLKEQDLHIRTDGWMATINHDDRPRYLYDNELIIDDKISLTESLLKEVHNSEKESTGLLTFHYFDEFEAVSSDEFIFETRFRNTFKKSNGICQRVQILVHGKDAVYLTPFSIPGCSSEIDLITSGTSYSGKENDLSAFGINTSEWNNFKLVVKNGTADYFVNGDLIFSKAFDENIGDIVGFKFRFEGAGELGPTKLSNTNGIVFSENFSSTED